MGLAYKVLCRTLRSYYPGHFEVEEGRSSCFSRYLSMCC